MPGGLLSGLNLACGASRAGHTDRLKRPPGFSGTVAQPTAISTKEQAPEGALTTKQRIDDKKVVKRFRPAWSNIISKYFSTGRKCASPETEAKATWHFFPLNIPTRCCPFRECPHRIQATTMRPGGRPSMGCRSVPVSLSCLWWARCRNLPA